MSDDYQRIELITGVVRRRHWTTEQKLQIIEATRGDRVIGCATARRGSQPAVSVAPVDDRGRSCSGGIG